MPLAGKKIIKITNICKDLLFYLKIKKNIL